MAQAWENWSSLLPAATGRRVGFTSTLHKSGEVGLVALLQDSSQAGQLSYHADQIRGLELAHPNIYFIHDLVGM